MTTVLDAVHQGDCIEWMQKLQPGTVDLAFADPPFNIGYEYDVYDDRRAAEDYLAWSRQWIAGVHRALKPDGTFWLAIGDEFAAELKIIAQREVGFHCRSWVIWYYTFGVNCKNKFTRSHAHLFHFVKDPRKFTFNADDPAIRVPSARQLVYADPRANPKGRLPDDTWILRPQDLPDGFQADGDVWYFSRVAGTFKERAGFHGCQMPERLLARIITACSNPGETVLDPFAGSGSTLVAAKKLGRKYLGFELSTEYASRVKTRLESVSAGDKLDGAADPLRSAPATRDGRKLASVSCERKKGSDEHPKPPSKSGHGALAEDSHELRQRGIVEAFHLSSDGFSVDRLIVDPDLNANFIRRCYQFGLPGDPASWNRQLLALRKSSKLGHAGATRRYQVTAREMDDYSFASEIAWHDLGSEEGWSLDDILCDPSLAARFDEHARRLSPGFSSLQYRWAALSIRKRAKAARRGARALKLQVPRARRLDEIDLTKWVDLSGVYLLKTRLGKYAYIGQSFNLGKHLERQQALADLDGWRNFPPHFVQIVSGLAKLDQAKAYFVKELQPALNVEQWDWSKQVSKT